MEVERRTRAARSNPTRDGYGSNTQLYPVIDSVPTWKSRIMCRLIVSVFCRWSDTKLPSTLNVYLVCVAIVDVRLVCNPMTNT